MHKVFISVAGEDLQYAVVVAKEFAANLVYLYTANGENAADMWTEEAEALRSSSVLVIFWSQHYVKKRGTLREIGLAVELLGQKKLGHPLIVKLDNTPLDAVGMLASDPSFGVQLLGPLIERWRALPAPFSKDTVVRALEDLVVSDGTLSPPEHDRPEALQRFVQGGSNGPRQVRPIFWVHGHEGYGRRFLVEKYMRQFDPNSRRIEISILDSDGPLTALLRLRGRWSNASETELEDIISASPNGHGGIHEISAVAAMLDEVANGGGHVVFTFEALNQDASRWIPEWLLKLISIVSIGRRPKAFFISQFSFPQSLLRSIDLAQRLAPVSVSSLEFEESKEYAYRLTGFFDANPERWMSNDIEQLADEAEGNLLLLIAISRMKSTVADLHAQAQLPVELGTQFTAKLNRYLDSCVENLRPLRDAYAILRTISDLQLVSFADLKAMYPRADLAGLLGRMLDMSIVEAPEAGLYRVPRLVVRRLDTRIDLRGAPSSDLSTLHERFRRLLESTPKGDREPVIVSIETRVRSLLAIDGDPADQPYSKFITASYLMQAGIHAYDRQDHSVSLRLLRNCLKLTNEIPELNTRCVMLRYYGLAAARVGKSADIQKAVELLRAEGVKARGIRSRVNPEADADFVLGFECRLDERWGDATKHYRRSLTRLQEDGSKRIGDCHRELAECYLHQRPAHYDDARFHAKAAYESRDNIMSLDILVKALIQSCWHDEKLDSAEQARLSRELDRYMAELEIVSNRLGRGMWQQRMAEDLLLSETPEGVAHALKYAEEALQVNPRQDFHPLVWKILLFMATDDSLGDLIGRTKEVFDNNRFNERTKSVAAKYAIAAYIKMGDPKNAQALFIRHKSGFPFQVLKQIQNSIDKRDLAGANWIS